MAPFTMEKSLGALTLDNYVWLWNQFGPVLAYSLCQGEEFITCLWGFRFISLSERPASLPCVERKLLGLEHMWFGRPGVNM